jgi:hypothetical protein
VVWPLPESRWILHRIPLCTDKTAAQAKLNALIRKSERADAGLPDYDECLKQPIGRHLDDYRRRLASKNNTADYVELTMARVAAAMAGCNFRTLADLDAGDVAAWLADCRDASGPSHWHGWPDRRKWLRSQ